MERVYNNVFYHGFHGVLRMVAVAIARPVLGVGTLGKQASHHGGHSGETRVLIHNREYDASAPRVFGKIHIDDHCRILLRENFDEYFT
jgi:hypothetical protein